MILQEKNFVDEENEGHGSTIVLGEGGRGYQDAQVQNIGVRQRQRAHPEREKREREEDKSGMRDHGVDERSREVGELVEV